MSDLTLPQAREELARWQDALRACASGSTYSIGGRSLTRQDVETIRGEIQRWHNTVVSLEATANGQTRKLGAIASFPAPGSGAGGLYGDSLWRDPRT